jgi:putative nucleotidyltransferase with HDIG domain
LHNIPGPTLEAIETLELSALPGALLQFMRAVSRDDAAMERVAELVRAEPALAARILSVANSAAFRSGGALHTVQQSLQVLGVRVLRSLAACLAVQQAFGRFAAAQPEDLAGFWRHSLFVAELAQAIASESGGAEPEEAYLAGLLHDIGELLLLGGLGARYGALLDRADDESSLAVVERQALATDHAAVGAWLVAQWRLPSFMSDAVLLHHQPAQAMVDADDLTRTVWAAHAAVTIAAYAAPELSGFDTVAQQVGLSPMALARLCAAAQANVLQMAAALGVPSGDSPLPTWRPAPDAAAPAVSSRALKDTVAAMAALQPLQMELAAADSVEDLLVVARESACILFGVRDVLFLLREGMEPQLQGLVLPGQQPLLGRFRVTLEPPARDAVARAAARVAVCTSFDADDGAAPNLRDQQLARALGSDGLVCVPLSSGDMVWGVMVCPASRAGADRLLQRGPMLDTFGITLAGQWQAWRAAREGSRQRLAAAADEARLRGQQVAHEVNNPLSVIKTYLQIMQRKLPQDLGLDDELQVLREEIDRVARIVQELGRTPAADARTIDLNSTVEGLGLLYGPTLFEARGVELSLQLQKPLAATRADRDAIRQVLLNLWKNAAEALPSGSRLVTSTADHVHQQGQVYTQLSVVDNGPGLPDDVKRRLFQPLGQNRSPGHSGLGLSIVGQLVKKLGGRISCQSSAGRGTGYTILLPQEQTPLIDLGGSA